MSRFVLCFTLLLATAGNLFAQAGATGTILGTVTDISGAVIPKATVTITNVGTGVRSTVTTTSVGDFTVLSLIPGQYKVTADAPGFASEEVTGVTLAVNQQARVNLTLKTGSTTTT
ncbi:MAG: carboxypeptidase-like regulatory domain-containing protein, partial [Acidobacteriaceae bacterium]